MSPPLWPKTWLACPAPLGPNQSLCLGVSSGVSSFCTFVHSGTTWRSTEFGNILNFQSLAVPDILVQERGLGLEGRRSIRLSYGRVD